MRRAFLILALLAPAALAGTAVAAAPDNATIEAQFRAA